MSDGLRSPGNPGGSKGKAPSIPPGRTWHKDNGGAPTAPGGERKQPVQKGTLGANKKLPH